MGAPPGGVHIEGLRDLRRGLSVMDKELAKELRRELKKVAEVGARAAKAAVPKRSGKWASKITAGATQQSAYVTWGRATVPYAGWMEWGGKKAQPRGGVAVRPRSGDGHYVHPAVKRVDPQLEKAAADALDAIARRAGW